VSDINIEFDIPDELVSEEVVETISKGDGGDILADFKVIEDAPKIESIPEPSNNEESPTEPEKVVKKPRNSKEKIVTKDVIESVDVKREKPFQEEIKSEENPIDEVEFLDGEPMAEVSIRKGITVNLGNFESFRIDVGITMPCKKSEVKKLVEKGGVSIVKRLAHEVQMVKDNYKIDSKSSFNGNVRL